MMPDRQAYRLTAEDETTIRDTLAATLASRGWANSVKAWADGQDGPWGDVRNRDLIFTLEVIGARAIGCTLFDLREVELQWLTLVVHAAIAKAVERVDIRSDRYVVPAGGSIDPARGLAAMFREES